MRLRLQYFDDCPSWRTAAAYVEELGEEFDLSIEYQLVDTPALAIQFDFHGSPSIIVDDEDLFQTHTAEVGLSCRIYQTPNGPAGSPTLRQLRGALTERS